MKRTIGNVNGAAIQAMVLSASYVKFGMNMDCVMVLVELGDRTIEGVGEDFVEALFDVAHKAREEVGLPPKEKK